MGELYFMVTIINRALYRKFLEFYYKQELHVAFGTVGRGTAGSEMMDYLGLQSSEKAVIMSVVTGCTWRRVKAELQRQMKIDVPGTGIAFVVPMSSIGGKRQLLFLTEGQNFEKGEESTLKETKYELLMAVANQGYTEPIMDAARAAGAAGGTVIHAKGTGMERAEKFLGISLVAEREIVMIVVKSEAKNDVMKAIMEGAGLGTKAGTIVFSLPVTSTAGMRLMEIEKEE